MARWCLKGLVLPATFLAWPRQPGLFAAHFPGALACLELPFSADVAHIERAVLLRPLPFPYCALAQLAREHTDDPLSCVCLVLRHLEWHLVNINNLVTMGCSACSWAPLVYPTRQTVAATPMGPVHLESRRLTMRKCPEPAQGSLR